MGFFDKITKRRTKNTDALEEKLAEKTDARVKAVKNAIAKKETETKEEKVATKHVKGQAGSAFKILLHPMVSEKSAIAESMNVYTFVVSSAANKGSVKKAIIEVYGVDAKDVRIINTPGKAVRSGRTRGFRGGVKKALVVLPKGKSISVHAGV